MGIQAEGIVWERQKKGELKDSGYGKTHLVGLKQSSQ